MSIVCFILSHFLYIDPRKPSGGEGGRIGNYGIPVQYERSFKWKVGHFRNLCAVSPLLYTTLTQPPKKEFPPSVDSHLLFTVLFQSNGLPQHIKISVSRDTIFEDSFAQVSTVYFVTACLPLYSSVS